MVSARAVAASFHERIRSMKPERRIRSAIGCRGEEDLCAKRRFQTRRSRCNHQQEENYKLHLPPDIPVKEFWSVILYSNQTRSMIQTDQRFPSVGSQNKDLIVNADGSVEVYFGPESPAGKEPNWVQTIPDTGWNTLFRLYSPLEPWFDKTWKPGEIELVE